MDDSHVQGPPRVRVQDGDVVEADGPYGEGHDGARGQMVVPWLVCSLELIVSWEGVVGLVKGEGLAASVLGISGARLPGSEILGLGCAGSGPGFRLRRWPFIWIRRGG